MNITQQDVDQLAARLNTIDLTDSEQAVLNLLVDQADDDVAGFAAVGDMGLSFKPLRGGKGLKLGYPDEDKGVYTDIHPGKKDGFTATDDLAR